MAKVLQTSQVFNSASVNSSAGVETVMATTPPAPTAYEVNHVNLRLGFLLQFNASSGTYVLKIYRGASTSAPLVHSTVTIGPSYTTGVMFTESYDFAEDVVGADNVQYTVSFTGATANAVFGDVMAASTIS